MARVIEAREIREFYKQRKYNQGLGTIKVRFKYQGEKTGCGLPYYADQCAGTACGMNKELCKGLWKKQQAHENYLKKKGEKDAGIQL